MRTTLSFQTRFRPGICVRSVAATLFALAALSAGAVYPERPIRLVLPYAAGGAGDILTRELADGLQSALGGAVITENRGGGGTVVGANYVAKQPADGYTILISGPATHVIMPVSRTDLPYSAAKDFESIGMWAVVGNMISVNPAVPVKSVRELIDHAKRNPGKLTYASAGIGTGPHLGGETFKAMAGVDLLHVPYKGAAPATLALLAGEAQVAFINIPPQMPHVKAGKIRALAVASATRSILMPDVPTATEAGLPGFVSESWFGVAVPAGTPLVVRAQLEQAMARAASDPERRARLANSGIEPRFLGAKEKSAYIAAEEKRLTPIIKSLKLTD